MQCKTSRFPYKFIRHLISMPFIWGMFIPFVFLDIMVEIYHRVAFPLYGIPVNRRRNYIRIDRQKLAYLSVWNKFGCLYCGYANGFAAYLVKICGDTEKYWCGIKHKQGGGFIEPAHQKDFLPYGDRKSFEEFVGRKDNSQ